MKNNNLGRVRFFALLVLVLGVSFSTMAYYTDFKPLVSEFGNKVDPLSSQGGIKIQVAEPAWEALGEEVFLKPGTKYPKDPTVTVLRNNADAYVFMSLDHTLYSGMQSLIDKIVISDQWTAVDTASVSPELKLKNPNKKVYLYTGGLGVQITNLQKPRAILTSKANVVLEPLFTDIQAITDFNNEVNSANLPFRVNVEAYAHQATTEDLTGVGVKHVDLIDFATAGALASFFK